MFNPGINDLYVVSCVDASLRKYADHDTTMQVIMNKVELIVLSDVISLYLSWSSTNYMPSIYPSVKNLI